MRCRVASDKVRERDLNRRALARLFPILAVGILASACDRESPSHRGIVQRLVEVEGPSMPFDPAFLIGPVFTWSFETSEDLEPWKISSSAWQFSSRGFAFDSTVTEPTLDRTVALAAETIDTLRVDALGFNGSAELRWEGPNQTLEQPGIVATVQRGLAPPVRSAWFDLKNHPGWKGHIERLRLTLKPATQRRLVLRQIVGTAFQPELLTDAAQQAWKLEFGNDARNAFHALPERPLQLDLKVPEQAELKFALGAPATLPAPFLFRIVAVSDEDDRQTLFERTIAPDTPDLGEGRWWDEMLDLSHLAGRSVVIRFENEIAAPLTPETGFPAWGHVEVIARRPEPKPTNVVLISIDTLRADRLSTYGYHRPTSPNIDAWARESGTVFERTVAPSPWTQPSHVSMFSGLDAHRHGVNDFNAAPAGLTLLPEILRQAGYTTAAITAGGFMHPRFGLSQGFDTYFSSRLTHTDQELETGLDRALGWLEKNHTRPFFLFFHTYEVHSPFVARQPFFSRWSDHDPELVVHLRSAKLEDDDKPAFTYEDPDDPGNKKPLPPELASLPSDFYDSAIAFTDHQLERLFTWLRANGLEENTLVALTSDHGEMLGEHGLANHGFLYDENLLIPLIIASPDRRGVGRRVEEQVRLVDLPPTILELIGHPVPAGMDGVSLLDLIEGRESRVRRPALSYSAHWQRGLSLRLDDRLKYIRQMTAISPRHGQEKLFNLIDDPQEENNLLSVDDAPAPPRAETLRDLLRNAWEMKSPGVWLRFENPGTAAFYGWLHGPTSRPQNLKAFDLPCACLTYEDGVLEFRMPPETSYELALEGWNRDHLGLGLSINTLDGSWLTLQFGTDTSKPQIAAYIDEAWQMVDRDPGSATGLAAVPHIILDWRGDQRLETVSSRLESDPSLVQELQALGYVQ